MTDVRVLGNIYENEDLLSEEQLERDRLFDLLMIMTSHKSSEADIAEALEKLLELDKDVLMGLLKSAAYFSRYYSELYDRELKRCD